MDWTPVDNRLVDDKIGTPDGVETPELDSLLLTLEADAEVLPP